MPRFVVTRAHGPRWDPAVPTRGQANRDAHAAFMDALAGEGFIVLGGPVRAGTTVLVVEARDEGTVRGRLARDPWTPAGLLRIAAIEPWQVWLGGVELVDAAATDALQLVTLVAGPRWDDAKPRREQAGWDAHAAYMDALTEERVIVLGGPLDARRALLVMNVDDEATVRARLAADPWADGMLTIERVDAWTLWLRAPAGGAGCRGGAS